MAERQRKIPSFGRKSLSVAGEFFAVASKPSAKIG
jgi:hypothetical protein